MPVYEIEEDMIAEMFELKENVKKSVIAVMEGRLTASHLASDVYALLEKLDKLEVRLVGEPLAEEVPEQAEQPAQEAPSAEQPAEQAQETPPAEQPQQAEQPAQGG